MFTNSNMRQSSTWHCLPLATAFAVCLSASFVRADEEQPSSRKISDQIDDELLFDQGVNSTKIDTETTNGVVTLTGVVDNILSKERAARIASTVRGVRSVVNRIKVTSDIDRTDDDIVSGIEAAWLSDPATELYEIAARVDGGTATLTGNVQSYQEKELAETVAKSVSGVRDVQNDIRVIYSVDRSDLEIRNEIRQALDWSIHVDERNLIEVEVEQGKVRLSAVVGSAAEKDHLRRLAWVAGVNDVDVTGVTVHDWMDSPDRRKPQIPDISDANLRDAIENALLYDPRVSMFSVDVDVTGGRATLRGTVGNLKAKRAAEADARNTYGVSHVNNLLRVRSNNSLSDAEIENRIEDALQRNVWVESYEVQVSVHDGIVDLHGTVASYFEKSQADDAASRVDGVVLVDNNLIVSDLHHPYIHDPWIDPYYTFDSDWSYEGLSETTASDTEIREEIKDELWWSPFVDADEVTVAVNDGVATLSGVVDSWHERQSAYENAIEGGATRVVNKLQIN